MKNSKFALVQILLITFHECHAVSTKDFAAKFKLIRGNATNYTTDDVERQEDLEYPGNNAKILQKISEMWQNYYECLIIKENEERKPEMHRLLEGQFVEFQCDICPRPFQDYEELEWKYKPLSPDSNITEPEHLDLTPEMTLTETKTLKLFNVVEGFSGLYACFQGRNPVSAFVLEVSKNDTLERANSTNVRDKKILSVSGIDFRINYKWSQWTECSSCGRVGKKFKYGTCYVSTTPETAADTQMRLISNENTETLRGNDFRKGLSKEKNATMETQKNENFSLAIVDRFRFGIPCASEHLPSPLFDSIQKFKATKALVKYCWVPCQDSEIFEVLDNSGRVIEIANNSAGIYSVFQKLPQLPPEVERASLVAEFGKDIIIQCPGTLLTSTPFTWKVNKKIIFPVTIANESNGRVTIDLVNRIHIKKVRLKDSHTYSCWQRDKLTGTVHLNVEKKFKIGFDHHVTLIGIMAIIATFLFVGVKVLTRELRSRKK